jgi:hypothetical protein
MANLLNHTGGRTDTITLDAIAVACAVGALGRNPIRNPGQRDNDESHESGNPDERFTNGTAAVNVNGHDISPMFCFFDQECSVSIGITVARFEILGNAHSQPKKSGQKQDLFVYNQINKVRQKVAARVKFFSWWSCFAGLAGHFTSFFLRSGAASVPVDGSSMPPTSCAARANLL